MINLPPNRSWVKLGDVVKGTQGVQIPKSKQITEPRNNFQRYLYISDFKNDNNLKFVEDIYPSKNVTEKDLIMVNTGATAGQVLTGKTGVLSNNLFKITYPENLLREYLLWFLRSPFFYGRVSVELKGAANEHMGHEKFYNYFIPLPPLPEQKKIVEKIEELFSGLDSGIASLKKAKEQISLYRQSVLVSAFWGKLLMPSSEHIAQSEMSKAAEPKVDYSNQLPDGWKWVKLGEVSEIKRGKSKHRPRNDTKLYGGKYPFIQTGEIRSANGGIINSFIQTYNETGLSQSKLWPKGTLCVSIAANIGETAFLGFDSCFPDSIVGILPNDSEIIGKYINYYFILEKERINGLAPATAQKNINVDIIQKLIVPLPPIFQQTQIVEEIEKRFSEADNLEKVIDESLAKSETLRQCILKKAFEGNLI